MHHYLTRQSVTEAVSYGWTSAWFQPRGSSPRDDQHPVAQTAGSLPCAGEARLGAHGGTPSQVPFHLLLPRRPAWGPPHRRKVSLPPRTKVVPNMLALAFCKPLFREVPSFPRVEGGGQADRVRLHPPSTTCVSSGEAGTHSVREHSRA